MQNESEQITVSPLSLCKENVCVCVCMCVCVYVCVCVCVCVYIYIYIYIYILCDGIASPSGRAV